MYQSYGAAVTKYQTGGLNNARLFSRSFGDRKFQMQVAAGLLSGGSSPLGLQAADFLPCARMISSSSARGERLQGLFGVSS